MHPSQLSEKLVPLENSNAGKEVSVVQLLHAPVKVMSSLPVSLNVTAGKEVKLASLQPRHASVKFVPLLKSNAGKDSNWEHPSHAPVKLMSSSAWVENVVVAGKEVIAVLPFHAVLKLVPRDRFKAGNVVRAVH